MSKEDKSLDKQIEEELQAVAYGVLWLRDKELRRKPTQVEIYRRIQDLSCLDNIKHLIKDNYISREDLKEWVKEELHGCEGYEESSDSVRCMWCGKTKLDSVHDKPRLLMQLKERNNDE